MPMSTGESVPVTDEARIDRFAALYTGWHTEILRFVLTLIPDRQQAEDVVQETARVLWQKFADYDPARPFWPWARQVAYFEVLKARKQRAAARRHFSDELVETLALERAEQEDLLEARRLALRHCVDSLPGDDRELLTRRYGDDIAVDELARRLGKSSNALYLLMHRIRQKLAHCVRRALRLEGWA
jgi:RNA polymerase sigma-70 factor, ECF subfamily